MNYTKNAKRLADCNMRDFGCFVMVQEGDERFMTDIASAEDFDDVDYSAIEYDEGEAKYMMNKLVKDSPYFLVVAENCRWDGASGYKFAFNKLDAIHRDYDTMIYPVEASRGGKFLKCREYSHDVPMGSTTYIVALTEQEYRRLRNGGVWEYAEDVAERFFRTRFRGR